MSNDLAAMSSACVTADLAALRELQVLATDFQAAVQAVGLELTFDPKYPSSARRIINEVLNTLNMTITFSIPSAINQLDPPPVSSTPLAA